MKILLAAILVVFVIWVISLLIQRADTKERETRIKKRLKERKKEPEKNKISFKRRYSQFSEGGEEKEAK